MEALWFYLEITSFLTTFLKVYSSVFVYLKEKLKHREVKWLLRDKMVYNDSTSIWALLSDFNS